MPKTCVKIAPDCLENPKKMNDTLASLEFSNAKEAVQSYPRNVVFSITDACNQECRFCNGFRNKAQDAVYADPDMFSRMEWLQYCNEIQVIGSGEALCHPRVDAILRGIRSVTKHADLRLYTNGLGLNGQRLDAALATCNSIHISMNAVTREVYDHVIRHGSYDTLITNLKKLSRRRPPRLKVILSTVVLRDTVKEIPKLVDFAAEHNFQWVVAILGIKSPAVLRRGGLPEESFDVNYADYFDIDKMKEYAQQRNVLLVMDQRFSVFPESVYCDDPWTHLRLGIIPRKEIKDPHYKWRAQVCCSGIPNIHVSDESIVDGHQLWNSERLRFIRRTVNSDELPANKMCSYCRMARSIGLNDTQRIQELRDFLRVKPGEGFFPLIKVGNPPDSSPE